MRKSGALFKHALMWACACVPQAGSPSRPGSRMARGG
jgi:hypothetical protein